MITLDKNYRLQNNNIHGVELVFEETRIKKQKDETEKEYQFTETYYYPNPVLAIRKYIELTTKEIKDFDKFVKVTEEINIKLHDIYNNFKTNGYKL